MDIEHVSNVCVGVYNDLHEYEFSLIGLMIMPFINLSTNVIIVSQHPIWAGNPRSRLSLLSSRRWPQASTSINLHLRNESPCIQHGDFEFGYCVCVRFDEIYLDMFICRLTLLRQWLCHITRVCPSTVLFELDMRISHSDLFSSGCHDCLLLLIGCRATTSSPSSMSPIPTCPNGTQISSFDCHHSGCYSNNITIASVHVGHIGEEWCESV